MSQEPSDLGPRPPTLLEAKLPRVSGGAVLLPALGLVVMSTLVTALFSAERGLVFSVIVRLATAALAAVLVWRFRLWQLTLIAMMFMLMATRQSITLGIRSEFLHRLDWLGWSEWPGFVVSLLGFSSVVYLGAILRGFHQRIEKGEKEIRTLTGLLPICAHCKKIRRTRENEADGGGDGQEDWVAIETYISRRSAAEFSHGICPNCTDDLYAKAGLSAPHRTRR